MAEFTIIASEQVTSTYTVEADDIEGAKRLFWDDNCKKINSTLEETSNIRIEDIDGVELYKTY